MEELKSYLINNLEDIHDITSQINDKKNLGYDLNIEGINEYLLSFQYLFHIDEIIEALINNIEIIEVTNGVKERLQNIK